MPDMRRVFLGNVSGRLHVRLRCDHLDRNSVVLASACDGSPTNHESDPQRFVGDAIISVHKVAPNDGGI